MILAVTAGVVGWVRGMSKKKKSQKEINELQKEINKLKKHTNKIIAQRQK